MYMNYLRLKCISSHSCFWWWQINFLPFFSGPKADSHPKTCSSKQFVCKDQVTCISKGWRCDGEKDCPDGSDESPDICKYGYMKGAINSVSAGLSPQLSFKALHTIPAFTLLCFLEIAIFQIKLFFFFVSSECCCCTWCSKTLNSLPLNRFEKTTAQCLDSLILDWIRGSVMPFLQRTQAHSVCSGCLAELWL